MNIRCLRPYALGRTGISISVLRPEKPISEQQLMQLRLTITFLWFMNYSVVIKYPWILIRGLKFITLLLSYVKFWKKNTAPGCKVFLMYFFVLISNLESKLKNLCHVFFKWHFKISIDYKKFNIWYFYFILHFLRSKIDSEQKSIYANFHKNW